jgi:hypothetical protein
MSTLGEGALQRSTTIHNLSLSPSRFNSSRHFLNSEISENQKKNQLHSYHIRNKNGSPTAQVIILKETDD